MSLTNPSNISERKIKSIIKSIIPNKENFYSLDNSKCFDTKKPLVVPSSLEKTHAALCGTAFDYLARFFIASKINSNNKESVLQNLVAERLISGRTDFYTIKIDKELMKNTDKIDSTADIFEIDICGSPSTYLINLLNIDKAALSEMRKKEFIRATFLSPSKLKKLSQQFQLLKEDIKNFINNPDGDVFKESLLIDQCIILARMEQIKRSAHSSALSLAEIFELPNTLIPVKNELQILLKSFKNTFLPLVKTESVVIFNPTFGIGSRVVGGADADIYIDGTLYDFKVTKTNGWLTSEITQLIGYYVLNYLAKKCNDSNSHLLNHTINNVALYKVRYEEIAYFNCSKLTEDPLEKTIIDICSHYIYYHASNIPLDIIEEFKIPITEDDVRFWDWRLSDPIKWHEENSNNLSNDDKEIYQKLLWVKDSLSNYLKNTDVLSLFKNIFKGYLLHHKPHN